MAPKKPDSRIRGTNLYLDPSLVERSKKMAAAKGISLSALVEKMLARATKATEAVK